MKCLAIPKNVSVMMLCHEGLRGVGMHDFRIWASTTFLACSMIFSAAGYSAADAVAGDRPAGSRGV